MAEISSNSAKAHPVHGDIANATHSSIYERLSHKSRWNRFGHYVFSQGVRVLDPWNRVEYRMAMEEHLASNLNSNLTVSEANKFKPPFAWKLREEHPDYVPVSVEKDARSDIPDIETRKYQVHRALMSAIDEGNKDEDGFLRMIYSGDRALGSVEMLPIINENVKTRKLVRTPIKVLDPWNDKGFELAKDCIFPPVPLMSHQEKVVGHVRTTEYRCMEIEAEETRSRTSKEFYSIIHTVSLLVCIQRRYHVLGDIPLGDFVSYIRFTIGKHGYAWKKPMFVYFKNTEPPIDTSMAAVDEKNKDEDGFLHITYSGKDSGSWTNSSALSQ
ncbi:hypothetical protein DVH24_004365 [Malus domestica]|uniref:Autophagy-related protein n=1 Tax=Malus domestica TaxID=3750 RepID=A0A498IG10_MALDO|nr:hypothetical protein DVH24_004365 [Malus domestica]